MSWRLVHFGGRPDFLPVGSGGASLTHCLLVRSPRPIREASHYVVRSDPLGVNGVSELSLAVDGELADMFDGTQRVVAVFIQQPYLRQVYEP